MEPICGEYFYSKSYGDRIAELRTVFLQGLYSSFGMTLVSDLLYVANSDALLCFPVSQR